MPAVGRWALGLAAIPLALAGILPSNVGSRPDLVCGVAGLGVAFAVNSSLHSYQSPAYAGSEKAADDVGFY